MLADLTTARRRLGGAARERGSLLGAGLVIWCDTLAAPQSVDEVTADLTLLEIPHLALPVARATAAARPAPPARRRRPDRPGPAAGGGAPPGAVPAPLGRPRRTGGQ
ncbi:hypothetical protein OHV05_34950 [Kitasatospora sp. NBC_00070]|uniref:hypothetical protein n=1 Tax=Kitasatospora sp. NBC_00070 TaxID=2975962 RepID=UPI00324DEB71